MSNVIPLGQAGEIMEQVLIRGDLASLTHAERARYYSRVCQSLGLNPLTRPFDYIQLNGKLTLYALKGATDQLRGLRGISAKIISQTEANGMFTVHVRVRDMLGREDEDLGVVTLPKGEGDARANAIMKAITKAKRRATLSLCGLGMLDETEIETIPERAKRAYPTRPRTIAPAPKLALERPSMAEEMNDELPGDLAPPKSEPSYVDLVDR